MYEYVYTVTVLSEPTGLLKLKEISMKTYIQKRLKLVAICYQTYVVLIFEEVNGKLALIHISRAIS